jgi:hypothetical protein
MKLGQTFLIDVGINAPFCVLLSGFLGLCSQVDAIVFKVLIGPQSAANSVGFFCENADFY